MAVTLEEFSKYLADNKGQRKFKQTVELAVNFKGIDFSKQDNRLNLEVTLPNGIGKARKLLVFTNDKNIAEDARKNSAEVIEGNQIEAVAADPKRLNGLLAFDIFAQPNLMPQIAKAMGQFLGPRNKMPRPLLPGMSVSNITKDADRRVVIRNKGKYLPTIHAVVGMEDMDADKLLNNVNEIIDAVKRKVGANNVKSAYVKLTMSKPVRLM